MSKRRGPCWRDVSALVLLGLAVTFGVLSVSGCGGGKLTRAKAEQLIRAKYDLTENVPRNGDKENLLLYCEGLCNTQYIKHCGPTALDAGTRSLIHDGLMTVVFEGNTSRMALTPKGQRYVAGNPKVEKLLGLYQSLQQEVWLSTVEFGTITGIQEMSQFNMAEVNWTVIRKATPFANRPSVDHDFVFGVANGRSGVSTGTVAQTTKFTKYDDGWRITGE